MKPQLKIYMFTILWFFGVLFLSPIFFDLAGLIDRVALVILIGALPLTILGCLIAFNNKMYRWWFNLEDKDKE